MVGTKQILLLMFLSALAGSACPAKEYPYRWVYVSRSLRADSDVADIKNSGGRYGGAITAAQFLAEFSEDTPWVHLDIAGTARQESDRGHRVKGATGVMVATLVNLAQDLAAGGASSQKE